MHRPAASALAGAYRSRFRGRGVDFVESRNYQPGDDIRNMDWRVTARTGRPHTKVFQEERERPVLLLVDASPSLYFGTRSCLKSVAAGRMAAAIAWTAVRRGDRIGAFLFSGERHRELRPAGGRRGAMRVIQSLVEWLNPDDAPQQTAPLSTALERVRHTIRPGSLLVVISDFYRLDPDCRRHLSRLRAHNDVIGCQVIDGEHTAVLDTTRSRQRARFDAMSEHHLGDPRSLFLAHQCGWTTLRTTDDPVELLGRELRVLVGRAA